MYVRKSSASGQGFITIPKSVLELLKKYFLGWDVRQPTKPSWNYLTFNEILSQMFLILLFWKFEKSKYILRIPCSIIWFNK